MEDSRAVWQGAHRGIVCAEGATLRGLHRVEEDRELRWEQRSWAVDWEAYVGSRAAGPLRQRATDR